MCIVCKTKKLAVLQVQTVEALAETIGELLAVLWYLFIYMPKSGLPL